LGISITAGIFEKFNLGVGLTSIRSVVVFVIRFQIPWVELINVCQKQL